MLIRKNALAYVRLQKNAAFKLDEMDVNADLGMDSVYKGAALSFAAATDPDDAEELPLEMKSRVSKHIVASHSVREQIADKLLKESYVRCPFRCT
jgi:hypothetical protein